MRKCLSAAAHLLDQVLKPQEPQQRATGAGTAGDRDCAAAAATAGTNARINAATVGCADNSGSRMLRRTQCATRTAMAGRSWGGACDGKGGHAGAHPANGGHARHGGHASEGDSVAQWAAAAWTAPMSSEAACLPTGSVQRLLACVAAHLQRGCAQDGSWAWAKGSLHVRSL